MTMGWQGWIVVAALALIGAALWWFVSHSLWQTAGVLMVVAVVVVAVLFIWAYTDWMRGGSH